LYYNFAFDTNAIVVTSPVAIERAHVEVQFGVGLGRCVGVGMFD